jgi:hypothetical protein
MRTNNQTGPLDLDTYGWAEDPDERACFIRGTAETSRPSGRRARGSWKAFKTVLASRQADRR